MDAETENKIPNQTTLDAIREMDEDIKNQNLKTYNSFEELLNDLDDEADPFYSEENQHVLEQRASEIKAAPSVLEEHDLIEGR